MREPKASTCGLNLLYFRFCLFDFKSLLQPRQVTSEDHLPQKRVEIGSIVCKTRFHITQKNHKKDYLSSKGSSFLLCVRLLNSCPIDSPLKAIKLVSFTGGRESNTR